MACAIVIGDEDAIGKRFLLLSPWSLVNLRHKLATSHCGFVGGQKPNPLIWSLLDLSRPEASSCNPTLEVECGTAKQHEIDRKWWLTRIVGLLAVML